MGIRKIRKVQIYRGNGRFANFSVFLNSEIKFTRNPISKKKIPTGGSPNHKTHHKNPQFLIEFPEKKVGGEFLIEFSVPPTSVSIGFILASSEDPVKFDDDEHYLTKENVIWQPPGWVNQRTGKA